MRYNIILLGALVIIGLAVPMTVMGAGDDCPPPSEQPFVDPGYVPPDDTPAGDDDGGGDGSGGSAESTSDDGGVFGSLGGASSGQITIGILAVVGVIVGATYLVMVGRINDEEE